MLSLRLSLSCLLAASLVSLATTEELPPNWWMITDEDPFASLQQELGDTIPDALKGGPVAAGASESSVGSSAAAGSSSSGASASSGSSAPAVTEAAKAPLPAPPPPRFPERSPTREETIAMAGFGGAAGSEDSPLPGGRPGAPPRGQAGRPGGQAGGQSRPPTRQPGGGPIVFPTDKPLTTAEVFSANAVFGGECTCTHPTSCTGQPGAPQGKCPAGQVCCPQQHQYRSKCGRMVRQPRSVQSVRESDAPWMAALLEKVPNGYIFVCGGSLIHEQVVLTAARCVQRFEKNKGSLVIRLGEKDILSSDEQPTPVEIEVKDILIHANFSQKLRYNDMALLFLREPAPLRPGLDTICVRQEPAELRDCSIHSYGLRQAGSTEFDLRLREADQVPMSFRDCQRVLRGTQKGPFFQLHPSFQCTNSDVTCDLGEDRAGSPLTCPDPERREHQLRGVVAWGVGCQSQQKPGVYTSVTQFYRWIDHQVTGYFSYFESAFGPFNQM